MSKLKNEKFCFQYKQLLYSLLGAVIFLIVFDAWLNDFIAMPLRVISTSISEVVVSISGYDVIREGTSLVVGSFRFNVDTACSGSKTMQEMIATAIILSGIWSGLSLMQKTLAVFLAIPIAVFTNGLRVSGLMLASIRIGHGLDEDTFEHQFIGILAFAMALLIFWQICKVVINITVFNKLEQGVKFVINILLLITIFFPLFYESFRSWGGSEWNPYNKHAWIFFILALLLYLLGRYYPGIKLLRRSITRRDETYGVIVIGCGLAWAVIVSKLGFVSIQALGFLCFLSGFIIISSGIKYFFLEIPVLFVMALSFPRMPLIMNELLIGSGQYDWTVLFVARIFLSVALIGVYCLSRWYFIIKGLSECNNTEGLIEHNSKKSKRWIVLNIMLLVFAGGNLLWQNYIDNHKMTAKIDYNKLRLFTNLPLKVGVWTGKKVELSDTTKELLGGTDASLRIYSSDYALPVEFFYNFSGGNRHNLHPPEYCLTGAGWSILSKKSLNLSVQNGYEFPITVMKLQNNAEIRWFAFWFYDGAGIEANYVKMLSEDLFWRLSGKIREWSIYRIIAYREKDLLKFINELNIQLERNALMQNKSDG